MLYTGWRMDKSAHRRLRLVLWGGNYINSGFLRHHPPHTPIRAAGSCRITLTGYSRTPLRLDCPPRRATLWGVATGRPKAFFGPNCSWDENTEDLIVEFTAYRKALAGAPFTGRPYVYTYHEVDAATAGEFLTTYEDGTYYNYNIRGAFDFTRTS